MGSVIILRISKSNNTDLFGNRLDNFAVIFGKPLKWKGILLAHKRDKKIRHYKQRLCKNAIFGCNNNQGKLLRTLKAPPPEVIKYYSNGEKTGILRFIKHKNLCIDLGGSSWRRGVK